MLLYYDQMARFSLHNKSTATQANSTLNFKT